VKAEAVASVTLYGYHYSVYLRIARMTLLEKGVSWAHVEVDPFAQTIAPDYLTLHPFGRVPTLKHGDLVLYETTAITRYVDEVFAGKSLQPADARGRARMNQIVAVADSYGYWPMVRQVFSQRIFNAALGAPPDEMMIADGLAASRKVLCAIETLSEGRDCLVGDALSLADLHLGAMVAYFTAVPEGSAVLADFPRLSRWWNTMNGRRSMLDTDPGLPRA